MSDMAIYQQLQAIAQVCAFPALFWVGKRYGGITSTDFFPSCTTVFPRLANLCPERLGSYGRRRLVPNQAPMFIPLQSLPNSVNVRSCSDPLCLEK